jgi:hypothetical protein
MKFDFTGAELFLSFLSEESSLNQIFEHPAYQIIRQHAQKYSHGLEPGDISLALADEPSSFYGLEDLMQNLPQIKKLLAKIRTNATDWLDLAQNSLCRIFPEEATSNIVIYPIIGYDMGIGLKDAVCMNLNWRPYLNQPEEFLYYLIHECTHVIYERYHEVPAIRDINSPEGWLSFFKLMVQNEGYAVYMPLSLRLERGHMEDRDYQVLYDSRQLDTHRRAFWNVIGKLTDDPPDDLNEILETIFGPQRLAYRIGCDIIRNIEAVDGITGVKNAFYMDGDTFITEYGRTISI